MDLTTTLQATRQWPVEDRLEFVFRLWDQLVKDGWQPEPTDELIAELDRRLAAHEADPSNVRTWEQIVKRVKSPRVPESPSLTGIRLTHRSCRLL